MTKRKCPHCNNSIGKTSKFCKNCGKELETGLTQKQKEYLKKKKKAHKVGYAAGGIIGGTATGLGIVGVIFGVILIIVGILLSLTIIGAIIGIPMIIIGVIILGLGGASTASGGAAMKAANKSAKKYEEIDDKLHGIKK